MATRPEWKPKSGELEIPFDKREERLYKSARGGERSVYAPYAWPRALRIGRNKGGCFAEVVARAYFECKGYRVLLSAPDFPGNRGYLLLHYRQKRLANHPAFERMQGHFPHVDLNELAEEAHALKLRYCKAGGGGDPDLFVYKPGTRERFFVEVKYRDKLRSNQLVSFPLIERALCPVVLARLVPIADAQPAKGGAPARRQRP